MDNSENTTENIATTSNVLAENLIQSKTIDETPVNSKNFETKEELSDDGDFYSEDENEPENDEGDEEIFYDLSPIEIFECLLQPEEPAQVEQEQTSNNQQSNTNSVDNAIDRLIEQRRNERALELRRLQFTNQTQGTTRNRLENWFQRNQAPTATAPQNEFRAPNILNEISELASTRRVTNVLSTSRSRIERVLTNMLQNNRQNPTQNRQVVPQQVDPQLTVRPRPAPTRETQVNTNQNVDLRQNTRPWLLQQNQRENTIEEITREQVIGEISELVHRQLVSNSLRSDFRAVLERRVMDRLRRIGTDGVQTREFIRNLPANTTVQRNDFSHIGINNNPNVDTVNDNLDSASSYNEQRRHRGTNAREIKELKNEVSELKNMLKLSFELQLDMQRSLKQEINALISGTFQNTASASLINASRPTTGGKCVICTESDSDTAFYQCGHICACYTCSLNLKQKNHNCPVCRAPIKDIIRTYKCSLD